MLCIARDITIRDKERVLCEDASLSVHDNEAMLFDKNGEKDGKLVGVLKKPEIIFINQFGVCLKGYEPTGFTKNGTEKLEYREWYCTFRVQV